MPSTEISKSSLIGPTLPGRLSSSLRNNPRTGSMRRSFSSHSGQFPMAAAAPTCGDISTERADPTADVLHASPRLETGRRAFLGHLSIILGLQQLAAPAPGLAALVQFPAKELRNNYFLIRAGQGESEAQDFVLTNPVAKTSMTSGLSAVGRQQVVKETVPSLRALGACSEGCWIWPSICQRSYQTAEVLSTFLGVNRSRIQPEYSFLDARGVGDLEGLRIQAVSEKIMEGDSVSPDWRPPKGTDGTPNESVSDVLVRVRQVLSITETQYRGADILIVSPDSDNLSILQAALLGIDLRQHHRLAFAPGEVRAMQLSEQPNEYRTTTFSCPNPPRCVSNNT